MPAKELKGPLGPLATVNCNRCASATAAFHRGDASRVALNAYCKADPESQGYLDQDGVHTFLEAVFQQHGLTPPLKAHADAMYHRFGPEEDRLEALACLCLADAMLRSVLRMHTEPASVSSRTMPSTQDVSHLGNAGIAPLPYQQAATTCPSCGEPCEADQKFCMSCGTRLPTTVTSQVVDLPTRGTTDGQRRTPALAAELPARQLQPPPVAVRGGGAVAGGTVLDPSRIKRAVVGNSAGMLASSVLNAGSRRNVLLQQMPKLDVVLVKETALRLAFGFGTGKWAEGIHDFKGGIVFFRNEVVSLSHGFLFERHYLCCEMLASCMGSLEMKRALDSGEEVPLRSDELRPPDELPEREAAAVRAALERWRELRLRVEVLRPMLEHEDRLMQDILDRGLGSEDRKTLRKLASVGARDAEAEAAQVADSVGQERHRLQEILMQNHRELLELSTTTTPDDKKELISEMDSVLDELKKAQDAVHVELLATKDKEDMSAVRAYGRSLNDLKALTRRLDCERRSLTKNSALAMLLVTVCRRILPARKIDPSELMNIPASHQGYLRILDFYFFSDASLYCFGEHFSGPNWFTRLKRNVAILSVSDGDGKSVYNDFAVSGEYKTPGAPLAPDNGPLQSIEAADENGRVFDRRHDAEFKLLTGLCGMVPAERRSTWRARATLWSKKPLCRSCAEAVGQVERLFPKLKVNIVVGEPKSENDGSLVSCSVPNGKTLEANGFRAEPGSLPQ
ncbi:NaCP60E [Symbiodinium sp. KB8]|nr:NaCP60E [Symbiodinium sp. KB8]